MGPNFNTFWCLGHNNITFWRLRRNSAFGAKKDIAKIIEPGVFDHVPAYEHNLNGHIERTLRTLLGITRCILYDARLSYEYWTFAWQYATVIYNFATHSAFMT